MGGDGKTRKRESMSNTWEVAAIQEPPGWDRAPSLIPSKKPGSVCPVFAPQTGEITMVLLVFPGPQSPRCLSLRVAGHTRGLSLHFRKTVLEV